jgi:hypothetical protein
VVIDDTGLRVGAANEQGSVVKLPLVKLLDPQAAPACTS